MKNKFRREFKQRMKNRESLKDLMIFINGVMMNHQNIKELQWSELIGKSKAYTHTFTFKGDMLN